MPSNLIQSLLSAFLLFGIVGFTASTQAQVYLDENKDSELKRTEVFIADDNRKPVKIAKIDSENFEITPFYGLLSIEDFDTSSLLGVRAAFHLTEYLFIEGSYGEAKGDRTSYEELSGGASILNDDDREYTTKDISFGLNVFSGEVWMFNKAFASNYYIILGVGDTEFGGDKWFTINAATGYRLFLTDWLALRIDARDHIFNRDLFGEDNTTHNIELSLGLSGFF